MLDTDQFIIHDISRFPLCVFRNDAAAPGYAAQWATEMAALIAHAAPFVVAFAGTPDGEAHEDRRDRAMWLKQNKAALAQVCRALVTVDADPARRAEAIEQGRMATKAFGIAHEAVATLDDAAALARRLAQAPN